MHSSRFALLAAAALATLACATTGSTAAGPYEQSHVIVDAPGGRYDLLLTREQYLSSDTLTVAPKAAWPALNVGA